MRDRWLIERELHEARDDLHAKLEALRAKVDIKARARERLDELEGRAREAIDRIEHRPWLIAALGAVAGMLVLALLLRRRFTSR